MHLILNIWDVFCVLWIKSKSLLDVQIMFLFTLVVYCVNTEKLSTVLDNGQLTSCHTQDNSSVYPNIWLYVWVHTTYKHADCRLTSSWCAAVVSGRSLSSQSEPPFPPAPSGCSGPPTWLIPVQPSAAQQPFHGAHLQHSAWRPTQSKSLTCYKKPFLPTTFTLSPIKWTSDDLPSTLKWFDSDWNRLWVFPRVALVSCTDRDHPH